MVPANPALSVAVIGSGYVGLITAACLADFGHTVTAVDRDSARIALLLQGQSPIYEPGLETLLAIHQPSGRLRFTTDLPSAVRGADLIILAVGTPPRAADGHADLTQVHSAAAEIAAALDHCAVIVIKSTVPVGTNRHVEAILRQIRPELNLPVCSNPEFLREGSAIADFMQPDRLVIGSNDGAASDVLRQLYRPLIEAGTPLVITSRESAELIKYAANGLLAMKVSFINEIADLCERIGADVQDVARGVGLDNRIGPKFLQPGPGIGGSCFPKDTLELTRTAQDAGAPLTLVESAITANTARKAAMADKVRAALGGSVNGTRIAVLGFAFKPNTDDVRASPALDIVRALLADGALIQGYDPAAMAQAARELPGVSWVADAYAACHKADAVVVLTEWSEFRTLELERIAELMAGRVLVDLRNIYDPQRAVDAGFTYVSIGRRTPSGQTIMSESAA